MFYSGGGTWQQFEGVVPILLLVIDIHLHHLGFNILHACQQERAGVLDVPCSLCCLSFLLCKLAFQLQRIDWLDSHLAHR